MKVVIKDLPKNLNTEEFKNQLNSRHIVEEIDYLKSEDAFRRVAFIKVPNHEVSHFISYYNNSYYGKYKIRCELYNKHEFKGKVNEEWFRNVGEVEFLKNDENTVLKTGKINTKNFIKAVIKNGMIEAENSARTAEYYNTLFFDFNRIIESSRIDKTELIKENPAVRIAYLESELVYETKVFLEKNGIFLDNLNGKRSNTAVIVKDFKISELPKNVDVVLGPKNTIAILEFQSSKLAEIFVKANNAEFVPLSEKPENKTKCTSSKVVVKNIPFQANAEELKMLFLTKVEVIKVRIPIKQGGQSKGFAFVECKNADEATKLIDFFGNSTHFYGRRLVIEESV